MNLKDYIRTVPDFPKKDILFKDITPILQDAKLLKYAIDEMCKQIQNLEFDLIIGPESRGFIFGMPIAYKLEKGFIPVRKEGKLPSNVLKKSYNLEYGSANIEMHADAIKKGQKVIIIDDLLATGGTCNAICDLILEAGGIVEGIIFFIELSYLDGRNYLQKYNVKSVINY